MVMNAENKWPYDEDKLCAQKRGWGKWDTYKVEQKHDDYGNCHADRKRKTDFFGKRKSRRNRIDGKESQYYG